MPGREYLNRQAATLLKFAKTTTDPTVAAGLVEKAADLKEQAEEPRASPGYEATDAAGGVSLPRTAGGETTVT
ncbi:hypothetical protein QA641_00090 [Bradyrhizobium sp. CB1650]|uniref:hypothetical protein n=1 Tax=Bradyrhizobium sp. CB1650 TaxID=3039153 RepID=UPI0024349798|nr:hypothetical protein [Bradyrhizobium sp. CB1650]WGD52394.1 hypothetical protein QA641_00090 [Bradyrhizobium sp. CB1650]